MSGIPGDETKVMASDKSMPEDVSNPLNETDLKEVHSKVDSNQVDEESNEHQTEESNKLEKDSATEHGNGHLKVENDDSDPEFEQGNIENDAAQDPSSSNKDYAKLFEKYQERFYKVYSISQKLFQSEVSQRQALGFYQRRNNALIDLLEKLEAKEPLSPTINRSVPETDKLRIENLISMNPRLQNVLTPLLAIDDPQQEFKQMHKINLLINEAIPDLINDDMSNFELNPQDIEPWVRRHYPNLVISKYKPLTTSASKFKETVDTGVTTTTKRKRKSKDDENDEDPQSKKSKK